jgi:hypothetical protein
MATEPKADLADVAATTQLGMIAHGMSSLLSDA